MEQSKNSHSKYSEYQTRLSNSEIPTNSRTDAEYNVRTNSPNHTRIDLNNLTTGDTATYETEPEPAEDIHHQRMILKSNN